MTWGWVIFGHPFTSSFQCYFLYFVCVCVSHLYLDMLISAELLTDLRAYPVSLLVNPLPGIQICPREIYINIISNAAFVVVWWQFGILMQKMSLGYFMTSTDQLQSRIYYIGIIIIFEHCVSVLVVFALNLFDFTSVGLEITFRSRPTFPSHFTKDAGKL